MFIARRTFNKVIAEEMDKITFQTKIYLKRKWRNIDLRVIVQVALLFIVIFMSSGCTLFKAIKIINGGNTEDNAKEDSRILFSLHGHLILVKVKLNNDEHERTFVADTGAITAISKTLADTMQFQNSVEILGRDSTGAEKEIQLVEIESLKIGNNEIKNCGAGIFDFSLLERAMGIKVDGILGSNVLRFFNTKIDYKNKIILLSQNTQPLGFGRYRMPFEQDMKYGFAPVVQIKIEDRYTIDGLIDTGYDGCVAAIPATLIKKLNYPTKKIKGVGGGGLIDVDTGGELLKLRILEVGNMVRVSNIPVQSTKIEKVLLGKKFLEKFIVTINYLTNELALEPLEENLKFDDNIFDIGIHVLDDEQNKAKIIGMLQDSPAEKAGIRLGDEILKVNKKHIRDYSKPELIENIVLNDEVNHIELNINRDGMEMIFNLDKAFVFEESRQD